MAIKHITTLFAALSCAALLACGGGSGGGDEPVTFTLTVEKAGNGVGTVSGGGIDCGATCTADLREGTALTLTAAATAGSTFNGWGGACASRGTFPTCPVTMSAAQAVTATFLGRRLIVTRAGTGGGTVQASPDGLSCGAFCTAYAEGTTVTLSAAATPDSTFAGWSGDCAGTEPTCTVTMSTAREAIATFDFAAPQDGVCWLPSEFSWTSSGVLAEPAEGFVSLKDFTVTDYDGQHVVYMSNVSPANNGTYGAAFATFAEWEDFATATQTPIVPAVVAPTLFYFTPTEQWILAYQWGPTQFSYRTSSDPTDAAGWSEAQPLYATSHRPEAQYDAIDQTVICDDTDCYLFFAGDNGRIYRSSMAIGDFPGTFPAATTIMRETTNDLFEAVQIYTVNGTGQYLMIVECIGAGGTAGRYFRAFTATDLGGEWTPITRGEAQPFAGAVNVTFDGTPWTTAISHGDLVRENPDQTFTVDACGLQLLYQGCATCNQSYNLIPWRPGLATQVRPPMP